MRHIFFYLIIVIIFILISAPVSLNYNFNFGTYALFYKDNPFLVVLCILIFIVSLIFLMYILFFANKILKNRSSLFVIITIILMVTTIFFFSPILLFLFTFISGGILLSLIFSNFIHTWIFKNFSVPKILDVLEYLNIINFFFKIYYCVFIRSTKLNFLFILYGLHLSSFFYVLLARIYILTTVVYMVFYSPFISFLIYLNIFLCLMLFFCRFLINLSLPLIEVISISNPTLFDNLLLMETGGEQVPPPVQESSGTPSSASKSNYSLFSSFRTRTTNHYHYPISSRTNLWRSFGLTMGVCTLGVGCVTAYYSYQSAQAAQKANEIAQKAVQAAQKANEIAQKAVQATIENTEELKRQNDLELLSQDKMSYDRYCQKYPKDCT